LLGLARSRQKSKKLLMPQRVEGACFALLRHKFSLFNRLEKIKKLLLLNKYL
jgi:hypothetical protein